MSSGTMNPEDTQRLLDMLPSSNSLRQIARVMGKRQELVRLTAAPFIALMRINGTLPDCPCGRPKFHPYPCSSVHSELRKQYPVSPYRLARREAAIEMLIAGARYVDIETTLGMKNGGAKNYMRFLTSAQRSAREVLRPTRPSRPRKKQSEEP